MFGGANRRLCTRAFITHYDRLCMDMEYGARITRENPEDRKESGENMFTEHCVFVQELLMGNC